MKTSYNLKHGPRRFTIGSSSNKPEMETKYKEKLLNAQKLFIYCHLVKNPLRIPLLSSIQESHISQDIQNNMA